MMKSIFTVWFTFVVGPLMLLDGCCVNAWNRQIFNRYSRNLLRNAGLSDTSAAGGNNDIDDINALLGMGNNAATGIGGVAGVGISRGFSGNNAQQTEVYGIVEPLIEDTPCVDRLCSNNDDCCPTGVCVNTYGEGKCIYVYGRKRDLCYRNTDCELGMSCLQSTAGNFICQPSSISRMLGSAGISDDLGLMKVDALNKGLDTKQFGDECNSSGECNVAKGMCCQLQRTHHRMSPKKMCVYFHDPFMCIDLIPSEDEEIHYSSSFTQRRI